MKYHLAHLTMTSDNGVILLPWYDHFDTSGCYVSHRHSLIGDLSISGEATIIVPVSDEMEVSELKLPELQAACEFISCSQPIFEHLCMAFCLPVGFSFNPVIE